MPLYWHMPIDPGAPHPLNPRPFRVCVGRLRRWAVTHDVASSKKEARTMGRCKTRAGHGAMARGAISLGVCNVCAGAGYIGVGAPGRD